MTQFFVFILKACQRNVSENEVLQRNKTHTYKCAHHMFFRERFYCHKNCLFFSFQQLLKIRKRSRRFQVLHYSPFLFKKIEIMKDVSLCLLKPINSFGAIPKKDRRKPERITFILAGIGRSCVTSRVWLLDHKTNDVFSDTCAKT